MKYSTDLFNIYIWHLLILTVSISSHSILNLTEFDANIQKHMDYKLDDARTSYSETGQIDLDLGRINKDKIIIDEEKENVLIEYARSILMNLKVDYIQGYHEIALYYIIYFYSKNKISFFNDTTKEAEITTLVSNICHVYVNPLYKNDWKLHLEKSVELKKAINDIYEHDLDVQHVNILEDIITLFARSTQNINDWCILNNIILKSESFDTIYIIILVFFQEIKEGGIHILKDDPRIRKLEEYIKAKKTLQEVAEIMLGLYVFKIVLCIGGFFFLTMGAPLSLVLIISVFKSSKQ